MPVNPWSSPEHALLYKPFGSLSSHTLSGAFTYTSIKSSIDRRTSSRAAPVGAIAAPAPTHPGVSATLQRTRCAVRFVSIFFGNPEITIKSLRNTSTSNPAPAPLEPEVQSRRLHDPLFPAPLRPVSHAVQSPLLPRRQAAFNRTVVRRSRSVSTIIPAATVSLSPDRSNKASRRSILT